LYSHLSPFALVERLIEADAPSWHRWDGDRSTLLSALTASAHREFTSEPTSSIDRHALSLRRRRLLWLLDRLAPESDSGLFEPFRDHAFGIYAWGRRLPPKRRDELTRVPINAEGFPKTSLHRGTSRRIVAQALILAWCDSCPDEQLSSLLEWPEHWRPALEWHDFCWLPSPEKEFYRRCAHIDTRREQMLASLHRKVTLLHDPNGAKRELARGIAWGLWLQLLRGVAIENPGAEAQPTATEEWIVWFYRTLSLPAFAQLSDLGHELLKGSGRSEYFAQSLWIWLHGKEQWRQLHSYALCNQEARVFDRLAEIVPCDELDAWDDLVLNQPVNHGEIRAFCRWLSPAYVEALRAHFDHSDRDWGACAYQNYLAKAQEPILRHLWRRASDSLTWQAELLDRRLFAPERVRPAAIVEDIRTVEGDLRLQDPLNHRSF
jgi:hypothetical protein